MNMRKSLIMPAIALAAFLSACSKDSKSSSPSCMADNIALTETQKQDYTSSHSLGLTFDAKNNASKDYDISKGSRAVTLKVVVTTTDGSKYESTGPLTATAITAGGTASVVYVAEYGAGKTFQSYTITKECR